MGWRDRLVRTDVGQSSDANSANSAESPPGPAIGTNGTIGIGVFPDNQAKPSWADAHAGADPVVVLADASPGGKPSLYPEPTPELVDRLAAAMATPRPWQWVSDPAPGLAYLRAQARRRLRHLDPLARGLLVDSEEAGARRQGGDGGARTQSAE
jgi:hypothetical protein